MPYIGTCFRFYTQMWVQKTNKAFEIEFIVISHNSVESKILAKVKIYILTRAELLFNLCYEIPCNIVLGKS